MTLPPFDSKRWIAENGVGTLAYGHKDAIPAGMAEMDAFHRRAIQGLLRTPSGGSWVSGGTTRSSSLGLGHRASHLVHLKSQHRVFSASTAHFPARQAGKGSRRQLPRGHSALRDQQGGQEQQRRTFVLQSLDLMASEGFLPVNLVTSPFRAATTPGSRATHSVDL